MKIFITGGCGFIGSHVLKALLAAGHSVRALRRTGSMPRIPLEVEPKWIEGDLSNFSQSALDDCDVFIHLAAAGVHDLNDWNACFDVNVTQSIQIWRQAVAAGIKQFIITGSCFEYGLSAERYERIPVDAPLLPTAAYHASKASASMAAMALCVEHRLNLSILRPFHVYGEGEAETRFWPALRNAAFSGNDFLMTRGEQVRDFINVEDVARKYIEVMLNPPEPKKCQIMNVGLGSPMSLHTFADCWWGKWSARGALKIGSVPYRPGEVMRYVPEI